MGNTAKRLLVMVVLAVLFVLGALTAAGADESSILDDPATAQLGDVETSSISFERTADVDQVTYRFTFGGPGAGDFSFEDPNGCSVNFVSVVGSATQVCHP